jgi:hypothetical protein
MLKPRHETNNAGHKPADSARSFFFASHEDFHHI